MRSELLVAAVARVWGRALERRDSARGDLVDAIVVLGAPLRSDGEPTEVVAERVRVGVELWQRGFASRLIMTGGGPPGRIEADAMAELAMTLGVPGPQVEREGASRSTKENAAFVAPMLPPRARVWLVTQPFHTRRSVALFRDVGVDAMAWHIPTSLQYERPSDAMRWIFREYVAWARYGASRVAGHR